ncbi:MAG: ABC transporter permease [Cytophagales bacterium]|nr:ABC transporter permease [Cytophagales bacterium]
MTDTKQDEWTEIIKPQNPFWNVNINELWQYRDLILLFVWRDFVAVYKQTILGPLWHVIQPVFTTLIFTLVFGKIAQMPTDGVPPILFYMSGITIWNYFSRCLTATSATFVSNAGIFGKVYFPRLTVPIATVISGLVSFGIQLLLFLCIYLYYYVTSDNIIPNYMLLLLPVVVVVMAIQGLSWGIIISSLTTKYRDLTQLIGFGVQLWMYVTPIILPLSAVPQKYRWVVELNPITGLVEAFRYGFLGVGTISYTILIFNGLFTVFLFIFGAMLFHKVEKNFMDTV